MPHTYIGGNPLMNKFKVGGEAFIEKARTIMSGRYAPGSRTNANDQRGPNSGSSLSSIIPGMTLPNGASAQRKSTGILNGTLKALVNTDPVTWGIIRMTSGLVNQLGWDIVPDINDEARELYRWYDQSCDSCNDWAYAVEFASPLLPKDLVAKYSPEVKAILKSSDDARKKRYRLETLFRIIRRELEQAAYINAATVRKIFDRPNDESEKSLRALNELVFRDILTYDAGVMIKGRNDHTGKMVELWSPPGEEIIPITYPDYTVPQPPEAAYIWEHESKVMGWYTNEDLTYIMQNPQRNGYGMSPVEAVVLLITGDVIADKRMIDMLEEDFMPSFLLNLKDATAKQRVQFEAQLDAQIKKSKGYRGLVLSEVPSENGEFQFQALPRGLDYQKMCVMEYKRLSPGFKAIAFGYNVDDLGVISDSSKGKSVDPSSLAALSERRAVVSLATLHEEYINGEIVKQEFPGITNVKFQYKFSQRRAGINILEQARADSIYVSSGILNRDEVREEMDRRSMPGGQVYTNVTGNSLIPIDYLENVTSEDFAESGGIIGGNSSVEPATRNNSNDRQSNSGNENRGGES